MPDNIKALRGYIKDRVLYGDSAFFATEDAESCADEIERLREALYECARNLEEQVSASYWHIEQPFDANIQRRYDRDMARARKAFAALGEKE